MAEAELKLYIIFLKFVSLIRDYIIVLITSWYINIYRTRRLLSLIVDIVYTECRRKKETHFQTSLFKKL